MKFPIPNMTAVIAFVACAFAAATVLADSGESAAGPVRYDPETLLERAGELQAKGCGVGTSVSLDCAAVPGIVSGLLETGEFFAVSMTCGALWTRSQLPVETLESCAVADAKLGAVATSTRYLDRLVSEKHDDVSRLDANLLAAGILTDNARFRDASPYFERAAALASGMNSPRAVEIVRSRFVNCLNAGDTACAVRVAGALGPAEYMFVAREYLARDLDRQALVPIREMARDGVGSFDELGVSLSAFSALKMPADAAAAALSCLDRCDGADTLMVANALARGGFPADAARFAERNLARFREPAEADFETGFLWLQAGDAAKGAALLERWAIPPAGGVGADAVDYQARQARVEKRLLADGRYEIAAGFAKAVQDAGGRLQPDVGVDMISAMLKAGRLDQAAAAAEQLLEGGSACGAMRYRLAAMFFAAEKYDSAVSLAGQCSAAMASTQEDPYLPARFSLLRARLVHGGQMPGDLDSEVIAAFTGAAKDGDLLKSIDRFAKSAAVGPDVELVAASAMAAAFPDDMESLGRLADAYVAAGDEPAAVDALEKALGAAPGDDVALSEAVDRLIDGGFLNGAIRILERGTRIDRLTPVMASRVGNVCLEHGDRECVVKFVGRFLDGPVSDEVNYFELVDSLLSSGFLKMAGRALDVAGKAYPWDRTGRGEWLRGRIALMTGDTEGAAKAYRQAVSMSPTPALIILAIAADYARVGNIGGSLAFLEMGIGDESPDVRAQVFPVWIDTLRRLARSSEITLEPLKDVEIASLDDWGRPIDMLAGAGRVDLAIELAGRVRDGVPASEMGTVLVEMTRLSCRARDAAGARSAVAAACAWAVSFGGDTCVAAAAELTNSGLKLDSAPAVSGFGPAALAALSPSSLASYVMMTLLEQGAGAAIGAAGGSTPSVYSESVPLSSQWPLLVSMTGSVAWDAFISDLAGRPEFAQNGNVYLDAALAALAVGEKDRASQVVSRYLASQAGNHLGIISVLLADGWFAMADELIFTAPPGFWGQLDESGLRTLAATYVARGDIDKAREVIARYLEAGKSSPAAAQVAASIRAELGDVAGARALLKGVADNLLTPESRLLLGRILWRSDDRIAAMEQFRAVAAGGGPDGGLSRTQFNLMGLLDSETGGAAQLAELLLLMSDRFGASPDLPMSQAIVNLSVGDAAHDAAARQALFDELRRARTVSAMRPAPEGLPGIREYVIEEARRGTAAELARQLLAVRGAAFAQTALFAACLVGDDPTMKAARERLFPGGILRGGPDERPDPVDELAVAGIYHACGRFDDALEFSLRYVRGRHVDGDGMAEAVKIAVTASAAAGRGNPLPMNVVAGLTDDRLMRSSFASLAAANAGDGPELLAAIDLAMESVPSEGGLVLEWVRGQIVAGKGTGFARQAFEMASALPDPVSVYPDIFRIMTASFRYADAVEFARLVRDASPRSVQAVADYYMALLNVGDDDGATRAAMELADQRPEPAGTLIDLATSAARARRPVVVMRLMERFIGDPGAVRAGGLPKLHFDAVLFVARFLSAAGYGVEAARILNHSVDVASDTELLCTMSVRSLTDGFVDAGDVYPDLVRDLVAGGRCQGGGLAIRLDEILAALRGGSGVVRGFKSEWLPDDLRRIVRAAAFTAILQGRTDDAISWLDGSTIPDAAPTENISLLISATDFLSDRPALPDAGVRRIGRFGLEYVQKHAKGDYRYSMAVATFMILADGVDAFTAFMDREIALDPSSEHNRNMTAYSLSVRRAGRTRFTREAAMAIALGGEDRGGYMETLAWGSFVFGGGAKAVKLQAAASAYWNTADYSTGLPECWNHYGAMLDGVGRRSDAIEAYRRSVVNSDGWNWHGILSDRRLRQVGFYGKGGVD